MADRSSSPSNRSSSASLPDTAPRTGAPPPAYYPDWAKELSHKYLTKTLSQFVLHGDVRDLVPTLDAAGDRTYVSLREFLTGDLFASRDLVLFYDRSAGIHFADQATQRDFSRAAEGYDLFYGTDRAQKLPKDPPRVFELLENYFRLRLARGRRIACLIDYAETVVPMAEAASYSMADRQALVFLQKWARDSLFLEGDFTLCLITESFSDLNQSLVRSPHTASVQIPIPGPGQRRDYVRWRLGGQEEIFDEHSRVPPRLLAQNTAGLNYTQLRILIGDVLENRRQLTVATLSEAKKEFIEAEAHGMLEFVEPDLSLDLVAGHKKAKTHLRQAARALKKGRPEVLPMGYLVCGPVGTGKTFLIQCFAGEIGIPMVQLKNFRSQWQGVTEGNLEKILGLLEAMTPVAVMIDEADAALGDRAATGDSGVSQRVFAKLAAFMSKPEHRGRILFFLATARPDLMPVDLKRQGRAEEHLALFYPQARAEREELLRVMMKRTGTDLPIEEVPSTLLEGKRSLSGADMEALLTRAAFQATGQEHTDGQASASGAPPDNTSALSRSALSPDLLQEVVDDFIPPTYPAEIELQTLAAVLECTSRSLLPAPYRTMDREEVVRRLEELKRKL